MLAYLIYTMNLCNRSRDGRADRGREGRMLTKKDADRQSRARVLEALSDSHMGIRIALG
jgi:hypothetical protein